MSHKNNSLFLALLLLGGCKQLSGIPVPTLPGLGPHKIDIQQGNVVTQEMLEKLQPGMTRNQVRFVLGTPLIVDPFRNDRWDYVYTLNKKGERIEQRQLKVYFKDDRMDRYEGDFVVDAKAAAKPGEPSVVVPVAKPAAAIAPVTKPPAEAVKPTFATPARDPDAAANIKPALRLSPVEGEPAKPGDRTTEPTAAAVTAPVSAATPGEPGTLESPPLPRLVLPPEPGEQPTPPSAIPGQAKP